MAKALSQQQLRCDGRRGDREQEAPRSTPRIRLALGMTFVMLLGFNIYYAAFPVHATTNIGWGPGDMGWFYASMSAAMFITQGPLLGVASARMRPPVVLALGLIGLTLAFTAFPGRSWAAAYIGGSLFALGNGLAWPTFQAKTADLAPESGQGALQGRLSSVGSFASIVGLALGGALYPLLGGHVFLASSGLFALALLTFWGLYRSGPRTRAAGTSSRSE